MKQSKGRRDIWANVSGQPELNTRKQYIPALGVQSAGGGGIAPVYGATVEDGAPTGELPPYGMPVW